MSKTYNPVFKGFSEENHYIPAGQVADILATMQNLNFLERDFAGNKIKLYKDTENSIYCVLPDSILGEGTFGVVSVCQNIQTGQVYVIKILKGDNPSGLQDEVVLANTLADAKLYPEKSYVSMQLKIDSSGVPEGDKATLDSVAIFPLLSGEVWSQEYITAIPEPAAKPVEKLEEKGEKEEVTTDTLMEVEITKRQANRAASFVEVPISNEERVAADTNLRNLNQMIQEIKRFQPIPTRFEGTISDNALIELVDNIKRTYPQKMRTIAKYKTIDKDIREIMKVEQENKTHYLHGENEVDVLKVIHDVSSGLLSSAIAVKELHKIGILHCDVKPENIIVDRASKAAFLCDLGTVMTKASGELEINKDGMLYKATTCPLAVGSPAYLAPEIYENYQIAKIAQTLFIDQAKLKWHIDKRRKPGEIVKVSFASKRKTVRFQVPDIEISDKTTIADILGIKSEYIEPQPSVYSEKSDAYSLGASAVYVLSHMLEKLKIGNRNVTEDDVGRANALLPEAFLNPENNQTINLANTLLKIINGLMEADPAKRLSVTEATERLATLDKNIEKRMTELSSKVIDSVSEKKVDDDKYLTDDSMSISREDSTYEYEPMFQVLPQDYTIKPNIWDAVKSDIEYKLTLINDKYGHARGIDDDPYRDSRSFIYSETHNTVELTENFTHGFPLDKLTIKNNTNTLSVSIPLSWTRNNSINIPLRKEMLIGVLESIKMQTAGSKVVICNCAGRPEMAKAMYKLAVESGMQPVYSKDGSDPRSMFEKMLDKGVKSRWNPK